VSRYAAEAGWTLQDTRAQTRGFDPDWTGDGVISFHGPSLPHLKFLKEQTVPVVDIGEYGDLSDFPRVRTDAVAIARLAVEYFAGRGFKDVGFVGDSSSMKRRRDAMRAEAERLGLRFTLLSLPQLKKQAETLPRPIGLLAATDGVAVYTMALCEDLGLAVPERVAIMGIDNDVCRCLPAPVTLTSVDPNMERVGYEAAALLDRLMDGQPAPPGPIDVPPSGVVERESTNILATDDPEVAAALGYIFRHFADPITVADVGAHAGVSLRSLQARFNVALGRGILEVLNGRRVEEAQRLLVGGRKMKLSAIAETSGLGDPVRLIRAFRRYAGTTPRMYARQHKA
jgi:LacI family transcriptional regulator